MAGWFGLSWPSSTSAASVASQTTSSPPSLPSAAATSLTPATDADAAAATTAPIITAAPPPPPSRPRPRPSPPPPSAYLDPIPPMTPGAVVSNTLTYLTTTQLLRKMNARAFLATHLSPDVPWALSATSTLFFAGFLSGAVIAGRARARQFLAENAHRLPKTVKGWYFYHKFKQHEFVYAGWFGGWKYGASFAALGAGFCVAEAAVGRTEVLGREGWAVGAAAGVATSLGFAGAMRLNYQYGKYALLFGAASGLAVGALEDVYALIYGESVKDPNFKRERIDAFFIPGRSLYLQWKQAAKAEEKPEQSQQTAATT
ncbi:hypothetical protein DFJ73DRAFT_394183 [Zopfochytrium polystomum]|nr:hypothetical protein DFJ73DRAFT_394183 [Zopfochytrium polystomum]